MPVTNTPDNSSALLLLKGWLGLVGSARWESPELRAPFPAALCFGPSRSGAGGPIWVEPDPAPADRSHADARAAGAHIAADAVPGAEAAQVERADHETEFSEMRAEVAGAVGLARMLQDEE